METQYKKLRVTLYDNISVDKLLACIRAACPCYAYVMERGHINTDVPHLHFYLDLKIPPKTLKSQLRALGAIGNKCLSLKSLDEQYPVAYIAYMMKDLAKGGRFYNYGIPDSVMADASAYNDKVVAEMKEKKLKKKTQFQCIKEYIRDEIGDMLDTCEDHLKVQLTVAQKVVQYHIDKEILIRKFQIVAYVDTIMFTMYKLNTKFMQHWIYDAFEIKHMK